MINVRFVRQVVNRQTRLLRFSSDWSGLGSLPCGQLRIVLQPLILSSTVAYSNKVGAHLGRLRPATHGERSIPPACSLDLLPVIDRLNGHRRPRCKPVQGRAIATKKMWHCVAPMEIANINWLTYVWRRGWDSNPRLSFPNTRFPSVLLQPLGHLSAGVRLA